MQRHRIRNAAIVVVLFVGFVYIYPTLGWLSLSPEARQARLEKWAAEDEAYTKHTYWGDQWKTFKRWLEFDRSKVINLGLDLQGGIHMVLGLDIGKMDPERLEEYHKAGYTEEQIAQEVQRMALQTIERRVSEFETQEPVIQPLGHTQIQVQLPGEKDVKRAQKLITKTAYLTFNIAAGNEECGALFRKIDEQLPGEFVSLLRAPYGGRPFEVPVENIERVRNAVAQAEEAGLIPGDKRILFSPPPKPFEDRENYYIYVINKANMLTGDALKLAVARPDDLRPGSWQILFENRADRAAEFGKNTEENLGKPMAIVVDDVVVSAPVIQGRISDSGQITGSFTRDEAVDLAIALNSGSLIVPIREEYTGVVGASLGLDSIEKGIMSAVIGILLVVVFVLVYYRIAGLIANVAIVLNAFLLLAALSYFNATLTLPGIAGLILTLGMAVDANVLIYERVREEIRNGKSLAASIESGYQKATSAIMDSNITTLIAAVVLMEFGTGPIQGFATTLSLGVLTSVFTALVVTRAIFDALLSREWIKNLTMLSVFKPDSQYDFLGKRRIAAVCSAVAILIGMVWIGARGSNNFGVDFRTGTYMTITLNSDHQIPEEDVRVALSKAGLSSAIVQRSGDDLGALEGNTFIIRIAEAARAESGMLTEGEGDTVSSQAQQALAGLVGGMENVVLDQVETVGPSVSRQLKVDALRAVAFSLIFIAIYLWIRFEWRFSLGAIAALAHDVAFTMGVLALSGREISMPVVAAVLTIIGYSLNDTIVIFDRIREDMQRLRGRGLKIIDIMNRSINETLSRTILTASTTLIVLVVLFFAGGAAINDFAFVLIVGIVVGTYSSIFVASPLVIWLQNSRYVAAIQRKVFGLVGRSSEETQGREGSTRRKAESKKKKRTEDQETTEVTV